jgi:hypothetical protein
MCDADFLDVHVYPENTGSQADFLSVDLGSVEWPVVQSNLPKLAVLMGECSFLHIIPPFLYTVLKHHQVQPSGVWKFKYVPRLRTIVGFCEFSSPPGQKLHLRFQWVAVLDVGLQRVPRSAPLYFVFCGSLKLKKRALYIPGFKDRCGASWITMEPSMGCDE